MKDATFALDNARLWFGDGRSQMGHVVVSDGIIESVGDGDAPSDLPRIDLAGQALSPGLIDLMVLGGFGKSIMRDDALDIASEYVRLGVTSCQLCIGTLPWDAMRQVADNTLRAMNAPTSAAAQVLGLYLEGPFQHPDLTGASLRENALDPSAETVQRILDEMGDVVTMINVSPGTPGDLDAIRTLHSAGKVVSMAHSNADAARVQQCLEAGTTVLGHVWDNNSGLLGDSGVQQPTLEHVALVDPRICFIHLICDGTHVHPLLVQLVLRARGVETLCLVTDAVPRAGCEDGEYIWDDGRHFYKKDGVGRTDKGWLTGSALLLPDMFRNLVKFTGMLPQQAIRTVTLNPATSLGLDDRIGSLAPGRVADIVAWDENLRAQRVWRAGVEIEDVSEMAEVVL
jgi:N-acetylglucosamine-6-phosphate deacetylase